MSCGMSTGRNIIVQEAAMYILALNSPKAPADPHGRTPFRHPALNRTDNFIATQPAELMDKRKIAKLAMEVGILGVMRWKPRLVCWPHQRLRFSNSLSFITQPQAAL